jgi:hypothetical protein
MINQKRRSDRAIGKTLKWRAKCLITWLLVVLAVQALNYIMLIVVDILIIKD